LADFETPAMTKTTWHHPAPSDLTFTLRELAERIGVSVSTIKFWCDRHALKALTENAGRGTPRIFDLSEARVASLLVPFAGQGLTIGALVYVGQVFRRCFAARWPDNPESLRFKTGDSLLLEALDRAVAGESQEWLAIIDHPEYRRRETNGEWKILPEGSWRPMALPAVAEDGIWLRLDNLIPNNMDSGAAVVMAVNITARLALLR
jgi:hypothetical protein